jgi:SAM-dependent methyltransferase
VTEPQQHAHPLVPQYSPDLFRGTVEYYAAYRPRYPPVLIDAILDRLTLHEDDRLLDLACGTGEVALAFQHAFRDILAVDADPDMVDGGRQRAEEQGVTSITWMVGRAEDLDVTDGSFGVIAAGRAFHRLNRPKVAELALQWLRARGYFVDLGIDTSGFSRPSEEWLALAAEVYQRWLPRAQRQREDKRLSGNAQQRHATTEEVLADAGFLDIEKVEFDVPHTWTLDEFVGYLYSTSYSSRQFWGESRQGFEEDLRATLVQFNPSAVFDETMSAYFVVGRAP